MLVAAAGLLWFRSSYATRVYPSVSVADVDLGGLSSAAAKQALDQRAQAIEHVTITFSFRDKRWAPSLGELGVSIDTASSFDAAYGVGREDDARARFLSAIRLMRDDRHLPLRIMIDDQALQAWFDRVDGDLGIRPHDAYLAVKDGKVSVVSEVDGTVVDRDQAKALLMVGIRSLQASNATLPVIAKTAQVHAADLTPALDQLQQALSQPVKLTYRGKTWTLTAVDLGKFVVQQTGVGNGGPPAVSVTLDKKELAKWLSGQIGADVNRDPVNAVVGWNDKLVALKPSAEGAKLKLTTLVEAVTASFFGNHQPIEVPVAVLKPQVDSSNLAALGITTKLGVGSSNFDGSDDGRATNIRVGTNLLNGTLVPPHGAFSFNHSIGAIGPDKGYVTAQVIDGERIGRDYGGGICQLSTTVFRAALKAGMPITEWHPHRYQLRFYELDGWTVGLDASILQPDGNPFGGGDFQFTNPSDSWILVESYTQGTRVVVVLYGANLGYNVKISDPIYGDTYPPPPDVEQVDKKLEPGTITLAEGALSGLDVSYNRDVYDRSGNLVTHDEWPTHFYPRANLYKVSPDMAGKSPVATGGA